MYLNLQQITMVQKPLYDMKILPPNELYVYPRPRPRYKYKIMKKIRWKS